MDGLIDKKAASSEGPKILQIFQTFKEQGGTEADFAKMLEEMNIDVERMRLFLDLHYGDGNGVLYRMPNRKIIIPDTSTATSSEQFMLDLFKLIPNISWTLEFESDFQRMAIKSHEPYNLCAAKLVNRCSDEDIKEKLGIEMTEVTIDAAHWAMMFDDGTGRYLSREDSNIFQVKNVWGVSSKISIQWTAGHWHLDSTNINLAKGSQFLFRCSKES